MKTGSSESRKRPTKKYPTIAACGLDCGLCPRFYTIGSSRCPGCAGAGFYEKRPTCSFITCCVKTKKLEVCSECPDFPCSRFKSAGEYPRKKDVPSYPSYKKVLPNLYFIQKYGLKKYLDQQKKRIRILETMISSFDDGRSRSFFCRAANSYDISALAQSIKKAKNIIEKEERGSTEAMDTRAKARILKTILDEIPLTGK